MSEFSPPKPVFISMPAAVKAAIEAENTLSDIRLDRWAETYRCSTDSIREAWEAEMSRRSMAPLNQYESEGK